MSHSLRVNSRLVACLCATATALIAVVDVSMAQPAIGGDPLTAQIVECASIRDDTRRLECFDRAVASIAQPDKKAFEIFAGEGDWTSDLVTLDRRWRIEWRSTGQMLAVELRDADNYFKAIAGNQVGPGEGRSDTLAPGSYRINVRAIGGAWRVTLLAATND